MILAYSNVPTKPPRPCIITHPHKRVVVLEHGKKMNLEKKEYNIQPGNSPTVAISPTTLYESRTCEGQCNLWTRRQRAMPQSDSPVLTALAPTPMVPVLIGRTLESSAPRWHTTAAAFPSILGLYPAQILLQDIWSIGQVGFRLQGSLVEWIPFPQHQITTSGTSALMPENPLDLIFQSIPHQYKRWRLDLPQEFLRADIAFGLTGMEHGMDLPTRGRSNPNATGDTIFWMQKGPTHLALILGDKLGQYVRKFAVERTTSSSILYSSIRLFLSTACFIRCCAMARLDFASTSAVFICSSASLTASLETLASPLANNVLGTRG